MTKIKTNAIASNKYNKEHGCNISQAGSRNENEPRLLGSIVDEMLHGNSPLAIGYRQYIASHENVTDNEESGWKRNTDICMDVKTFLREDRITKIGKDYLGVLQRNTDNHYSFVETIRMASTTNRNPHVLELERINVNRKYDGTLYPTFNRPRYSEELTFRDFCREAAEELLMVAGAFDKLGLVEGGNGK